VQGNIMRFSEAFGRSLLELRREIEATKLRRKVDENITTRNPERGLRLLERIDELELLIHEPTINYTRKLNSLSNLIVNEIQAIAVEQGEDADAFLAEPGVKELNERAQQHIAAGTSIKPEQELRVYEQADKKIIGTLGRHVGIFGG
jgi:tRNA nucleotidyltransferase/poly(A) polymerase